MDFMFAGAESFIGTGRESMFQNAMSSNAYLSERVVLNATFMFANTSILAGKGLQNWKFDPSNWHILQCLWDTGRVR